MICSNIFYSRLWRFIVLIAPISPVIAHGEDKVQVLAEHRACLTNEDCVRFYDSCETCSCGVPLNRVYLKEYDSKRVQLCKTDLVIELCDINPCGSRAVACVEGVCDFVKRSRERAVFVVNGKRYKLNGKNIELDRDYP